MKRLLVTFLVAGLAVALYASTAGGGQQAVTPGQFAALKKQVATLKKQVTTLNQAMAIVFTCDLDSAVPLTNAPALHVSNPGEGTDTYMLATNKECADAINTPSGLRKFHFR
jgi:hypothetical protein